MNVKVKKLYADAQLPTRGKEFDAGWDLHAYKDQIIPAGQRTIIDTGISMSFPEGYVGLILDRSGMAAKHGITHMAGVMDCIYRGEYKIVLHNTTSEDYQIRKGDRVAQIVFLTQPTTCVVEVDELDASERGEGRFGSSGK